MRRLTRAFAGLLLLASSACVQTQEPGSNVWARTSGVAVQSDPKLLERVETDRLTCRSVALAVAAAAEQPSPGTRSLQVTAVLKQRTAADVFSEDPDDLFRRPYEQGAITAHGRDVAQSVMQKCMARRGYALRPAD
jgi:hypothetical protein